MNIGLRQQFIAEIVNLAAEQTKQEKNHTITERKMYCCNFCRRSFKWEAYIIKHLVKRHKAEMYHEKLKRTFPTPKPFYIGL